MFGTSSLVDIGVSMTLKDNFSATAGNISSNWKTMLRDMNDYSRGMEQSFISSINRSVDILKTMYGAFEYSAGVQKNAFLASTMINDGIDHSKELLDTAKEINLRNPLKAADITSGMKFMAMAGMTADSIKAAAEPAAQLSALFDMDMGGKGGTADLITNLMATFQITGQDANQTKVLVEDVANTLAVATSSANISLMDVAQSMKYVGGTAKASGYSIKDISAALGVLGNYGIQASMAGTGLRQALNSLNQTITGSRAQGVKALASIGLSPENLKDAHGELLPLTDLVATLGEAMRGLTGIQTKDVLFNIFNLRGMTAMLPLINDYISGANKLNEILGKINSSPDFLSKAMSKYMESPAGRIDLLKSTWENFIVTIGSTLSSVITPVLNLLTSLSNILDGIVRNPVGAFIARFFVIQTVVRLVRNLIGYIGISIKAVSTNLFTSANGSKSMAAGIGSARIQAQALEYHLRNISILLAHQTLRPGQRINLWGGSVSKNVNGVVSFNQSKTPGQGVNFFGGFPMMGGASSGPASSNGISPLMMRFSRSFGTSVGVPLAKGISGLGSILTKGFSLLMGPLGMLATIGIPLIMSFLSSNKEDRDIKAIKEERNILEMRNGFNSIVNAINNKDSQVNINLNNNPMGSIPFGGSADLDSGINDYGVMGY